MTKVKKEQVLEILRRPYTVELDYGETPDEGVAAYVVEWPGCITAGDTRAEALSHIEDAMWTWVEYSLEKGYDVPPPLGEFGGRVLLRVPKSLHRDMTRIAEHEGVSVNQWLNTVIARAVGTTEQGREVAERRGTYRSPGPRSSKRKTPTK